MKSIAEIADALGVTKQAAQKRANKEAWSNTQDGNKRLYPISTLPADIRTAIQKKAIAAALPVIAEEISMPPMVLSSHNLTDHQRLERDARNGIKAAIARTMVAGCCSQEAALHTLLATARVGTLDPVTIHMLRLSRDNRGRKGEHDDGFPSVRSLKRWLSAADLTPKQRQKDMSVPPWAKAFLGYYQQPQKPTVADAFDRFSNEYSGADLPSIHQVRRFLDKLGSVTRERGRMGARELKNIQPFIRRDFSLLLPNDVWTADGHTFDAEVQHPFHGRPFRPEITVFADIATRRAVGWSVDLAESSQAVADALRSAVESNGIPALIYVDNGSGYKNAFMNDAATGLVGRIGATMTHSLPYNSQARGVIERLHQTLWVTGAKQLPSYIGAAMDREARLEQFKLSRRAIKQGGALPLMPWDLFVKFCEERVADYNTRVHRSLNGLSPNMSLSGFEAKGWQAETLADNELATLFRPRVNRTLARAEIRVFNNIYFARELAEFHGMEVHVAYDIHHVEKVWVYLPDGKFICSAEVNGNSKHYFPVPVVEQGRQKRAQGRLNRVEVKREEILEELHGGRAITAPTAGQIVIGGRVIDSTQMQKSVPAETKAEQITRTDEVVIDNEAVTRLPTKPRTERTAAENFADWSALDHRIHAGDVVSEADSRWHKSYQNSAQYKAHIKKIAADPKRAAA